MQLWKVTADYISIAKDGERTGKTHVCHVLTEGHEFQDAENAYFESFSRDTCQVQGIERIEGLYIEKGANP